MDIFGRLKRCDPFAKWMNFERLVKNRDKIARSISELSRYIRLATLRGFLRTIITYARLMRISWRFQQPHQHPKLLRWRPNFLIVQAPYEKVKAKRRALRALRGSSIRKEKNEPSWKRQLLFSAPQISNVAWTLYCI